MERSGSTHEGKRKRTRATGLKGATEEAAGGRGGGEEKSAGGERCGFHERRISQDWSKESGRGVEETARGHAGEAHEAYGQGRAFHHVLGRATEEQGIRVVGKKARETGQQETVSKRTEDEDEGKPGEEARGERNRKFSTGESNN